LLELRERIDELDWSIASPSAEIFAFSRASASRFGNDELLVAPKSSPLNITGQRLYEGLRGVPKRWL
jgi:putative NADH-flavin reductase